MPNEIKNRLDGLTVEEAYDLGRSDGRAEAQEAADAADDSAIESLFNGLPRGTF